MTPSNFRFLPKELGSLAEAARKAEGHIMGDPRAACFHARFALEAAVHWLYRHAKSLRMPYDQNLGALLHEPSFQDLLPEGIFQKARLIQKEGNQAVHSTRPVHQYTALQVVKELHHLSFWMTITYFPAAAQKGEAWKDSLVPKAPSTKNQDTVSRKELEALEKKLTDENEARLKEQKEKDELNHELQRVKDELEALRATANQRAQEHDFGEAETRRYLIDVDLRRAGWDTDAANVMEYPVTGMPNKSGVGKVDYVLWGDDGKPLAVVEAKRTTAEPNVGQQQAKLYADCLEKMHGQRPVIYYTNGYRTWMWDDLHYPPRQVAGFYKKKELESLILRRTQRGKLDVAEIKDAITERYYQKRALGHIFSQFSDGRRKALLVMATGTGKTRTAISLVDVLQRAGWVKRALFLADRVSLVRQACNAFKEHLPEASPVNLVEEKNTEGRVYACTYPTMMGLIDQNDGKEARFGVGHFDLIIIDEAHRSVYKKFGSIFRYFDSLLVGLTATPREEVDKNTYDLFELEQGVPTDAYELETAVRDEYLVPPKVQQVDLRFPKDGISYEQLSNAEKEEWESLDWGDDSQTTGAPSKVNASAINNWLFNEDTVDKVLKHLMQHGHKVEGGDRLAKTIVFARNHDHAVFIEQRFNHHYPKHAGHFARIIDNQAKYPLSLIDDFSLKDKAPHIAISVDMLDTGIDVPEVANLVFFKPVYSKIKFWQMIGRGTRLCPNLFGPDEHKVDFRVFDFCFNFDFFREKPDGLIGSDSAPLGTRLFRARVDLLGQIADIEPSDALNNLTNSLTDELCREVAAMNRDNFIVRMNLETVETFQDRKKWDNLTMEDREQAKAELAGLPSEIATDDLESRHFDLTALRMQLALLENEAGLFERLRQRVTEIALLLEDKTSIPRVAQEREYLVALQEPSFWDGITVTELEEMRLRLRDLVPLLDKKKKTIIYTTFRDEVTGVREEPGLFTVKMTGPQYEKKVKEYLKAHLDDLVIHRLRSNQALTPQDLETLEQTLRQIGDEEGEVLLTSLLEKNGSPSLPHFVRSLVGMDRAAAQAAFGKFLSDRSLTPNQIRFIELIIEQLTARGVMTASALYEPPFTQLHAGGPDELFAGKDEIIDGLFESLERTTPKEIAG
ncbi:MAG: DEAD/DEAH box helicase family protein [Verrucomicrobiota bacterium JB023]|nr:DEAD/DEAH box helicase family protein [Verrucomicrobiota bacterium JB023]